MAITHVEANANSVGSATSLTLAFTNVLLHDLLVIETRCNATVTISDGSTNAWTQVGTTQGTHQAWCALNCAAAANLTVTISTNGAAGVIRIFGDHFSGAGAAWTLPAGGTAQANITAGTSIAPGSTGSLSADVVWVAGDTGTDVGPLTAGSSNGAALAMGVNDSSTGASGFMETAYTVTPITGVQNPTITTTVALTAGNSCNTFAGVFQAGVGVASTMPSVTVSSWTSA